MAVDRNGPKSFILAPDGEFSSFKLENDLVWGLCLDASDTSPFYLHTTYHLRAKSMRVFPNIIVNHQRLTKPRDFDLPPTVTSYTPGNLQIKYSFVNHLDVRFNCFIPEAEILVGKVEIDNSGTEPIALECEMGSVLIPMGKGSPTHPKKVGANHILSGQTDKFYPVLFMSGGPKGTSNPYPALCVPLNINPGETKTLHWALVSKGSLEASLETARKFATSTWYRASQIQLKAHARQRVWIKTGEPDWDTAFFLAQVNALTHLVDPGLDEKKPIFVKTRLPDQSIRPQQENDTLDELTLLDALHLAQVILPPYVEHLTQLVERFTARVDDQGSLPSNIQWPRNGKTINECPLLANFTLALFEINQDTELLRRLFPHLQRFFATGWLANKNLFAENLPRWESPAQLQLDTGLFNFDNWEETGKGLDIRTAESPALAAMLHREALALKKIAHILGDRSAHNHYGKIAKALHDKMLSLWDDERKVFTYKDRQSHISPDREIYFPGYIKEKININKSFNQPQRLLIHLTTIDNSSHSNVVRILGRNAAGDKIVEQHQTPELRWVLGHSHITTHHLFSALDAILFTGFNTNDRFIIETADYSQVDISCWLPLWSGGINNNILGAMVRTQLDWQNPDFSSGIPETWRCAHPLPEGLRQQVNIQWNTLIIDGLTREGFVQEAMKAFTNLMSTVIHGLKKYHGFYQAHEIESGLPQGQTNALTGLAPVGLFLKIAGIKLLSPNRVAIWGSNPFPWPIEVRWQGLWVRREDTQTHITFPDGTHYQSQARKPLVVKSEEG